MIYCFKIFSIYTPHMFHLQQYQYVSELLFWGASIIISMHHFHQLDVLMESRWCKNTAFSNFEVQ